MRKIDLEKEKLRFSSFRDQNRAVLITKERLLSGKERLLSGKEPLRPGKEPLHPRKSKKSTVKLKKSGFCEKNELRENFFEIFKLS